MLEHIKILISVICILAGTGLVILISQRAQKYPYPYIKSLFYYCIMLILVFFSLLITKYITINFPEIESLHYALIYRDLGVLAFTLFEFWLVVFLFKIVLQMLEIPSVRYILPSALGLSIILVFSYILKLLVNDSGTVFSTLYGQVLKVL